MSVLSWKNATFAEREEALIRSEVAASTLIKTTISDIFKSVGDEGNKALCELTERYDKVKLDSFNFNLSGLETPNVSYVDQVAIKKAAENIKGFHQAQFPKPIEVETMAGVVCEKQWRAIETVGLYIPGGSAPLISTLLMLAIPAQIAGVKNIVLCTPPQKGKNLVNPHIIWAAKWLGFETIYSIGGAQAIAAMALGTSSVPKVDKIFGPGNVWVTEAKRYATSLPQGPSIDMPAGPSEVMVVSDQSVCPTIIAADLLAQAEHDPMAQTVFVSFSESLILEVKEEVETQLRYLSRENIARSAMKNAVYILVSSRSEVVEVINQYAPEHLIINLDKPNDIIEKVINSGSVFVGPYTPESVGDYASGTNHVLPTSGFARSYSGLGTTSFMKSITLQTLTKEGLKALGPTVQHLASLEGLDAHAQAVTKRLALMEVEGQ